MANFNSLLTAGIIGMLASVAGCTFACPSTDIGAAIQRPYSEEAPRADLSEAEFLAGPKAARNKWIENPDLDAFLQKKIHAGGRASLSKLYRFQCVPNPARENCSDCVMCTTSLPGEDIHMTGVFVPYLYCGERGQLSVRAEIGPGDSVISTTYWAVPSRKKAE